jgi:hypothetical protein
MKYSESEIRFLMQPVRFLPANGMENAAGRRSLNELQDLRLLGCPERIFEQLLEHRARKISPQFAEFRSRKPAEPNHATQTTYVSLAEHVNASELF